ncbi:phytanoyl-CoA dioxygenase family protein [Myxosarcina sp. GI1]|uniref:phytanoyl-CoA dioxygenase family protein n=1 Tax=Myxosarcina sp. GI1 TaxID=1541065 RepID=UPI00056C9C17|nr:phytanoyl-CoA dioxygenase family protein [Myxosarcina sp. GI1]
METLTQSLTQKQLDFLPTETDIAFYEEHGWYISPKVISEEIIDLAIEGAEKFYRGERDAALPVTTGYSNWKPEDGDIVRNNEFVSLQKKELARLALQPIIGAIAARLARTSEVRLLDDQLVYKPPRDRNINTTVGWHSDRAYWATCSSNKLLTAWIPFHDCDEARSPLVVLDKSHKWSGLEHVRHFNDPDLENLTGKFRGEGKQVVKVPMTLKKGQVSFHNCWTIHGSYPNRSDKFRLALAVHLQDADNHYRPYKNQQEREIHIFDEQLCRKLANGDPDFSDPKVFPVLWSRDKAGCS